MPESTLGSGISARTVGSRWRVTSSISTPRPASTRASRSGRSCRCAIASARAEPRSSSRSRQARPVADCSTPRKWRRSPAIGRRGTGQDGQHRPALRANQLALLSETHRRSAMPSGVQNATCGRLESGEPHARTEGRSTPASPAPAAARCAGRSRSGCATPRIADAADRLGTTLRKARSTSGCSS